MQRTIESLDSLKALREEIEIVARDVILLHYEDSGERGSCPYIKPKRSLYSIASDCLVDNDLYSFAFAWQGIFKAVILNRYGLRLTDRIFYEDNDFGIMLFNLARASIHPNIGGLVYRKRGGSITSSHNESSFPAKLPSNLEPLKPHFKNYQDLRAYYHAYCFCVIGYQVHRFAKQCKTLEEDTKEILQRTQKHYIREYIYEYSHINYLDPQGLLAEMGITNLEEYRRQNDLQARQKARRDNLRFLWRHPLRALKRALKPKQ